MLGSMEYQMRFRRFVHKSRIFLRHSVLKNLACPCLNPCSIKIVLCFLLQLICVQRRRLKYICASLILILILMGLCIHILLSSSKCNDQMYKNFLENMCSMYRRHGTSGNLCFSLCDDDTFHYVKCLNYAKGKVIIFGHLNNNQIILKTKTLELSEHQRLENSQNIDNLVNSSPANFIFMVRSNIESTLGFQPKESDEKLLSKLWQSTEIYPVSRFLQIYPHGTQEYSEQATMMKSLYSLVVQDEYLFLKYYSGNQFLPNIIGSCGHLYAMEYAPPTGVLSPTIFQWSGTHSFAWNERADIARKILDLVKSAETDYQEPLYFCDIKGENFGIANNGVVKPIDLDSVFFESKLKSIFKETHCIRNADCDFFDCKGSCASETGYCNGDIVNNNLQVICTKIFSGIVDNIYTGILSSPPTAHKANINRILSNCSNLTAENLKHTNDVYEELKNVLLESNN